MIITSFRELFILVVLLIFFSLIAFCLNGKHLLSLLLSLESMMIGIYSLGVVTISFMNIELYYSLIILTFAACEAAVGLSVLVNMISSHGSNNVRSLSLVQC